MAEMFVTLQDHRGGKRASLAEECLIRYKTRKVLKSECRTLRLSQSLVRQATLHAAHQGVGSGQAPVAEMFVTLHKIIGEESARLWQRKG